MKLNYSDLFIESKTGPYAYMKPVDRFWNYVKISEDCWEWTGKIASNGYGIFQIREHHYLAHRISYLLENGYINPSLCACHTCDNRKCVNPNHLFMATQSDNIKDMVKKKRNNPPTGEKEWFDVFTIRGLYKKGKTQKELAEKFNISTKQISIIVNNKQWRFDLDTFQSLCLDTAIYPNVGNNITYPVLGFIGEAGEIANKYKKVIRGDSELTEEKKKQIIDELGDCIYYLAALAFELGVNFSDLAASNLDKLRSRKERDKLQGDGDDR